MRRRGFRERFFGDRGMPAMPYVTGSVSFPAKPVSVAPSAPTEIPAAAIGEPREQILSRAITDDLRIGIGIDIGVHRRLCLCGHARIDHVDPEGRWFDGMCQVPGCLCTDAGYIASRTP